MPDHVGSGEHCSETAEDLFAAWAIRVENGETADIGTLLRAHPQQAETLRHLHTDWSRFRALREGVLPSGPRSVAADDNATRPETANLECRYTSFVLQQLGLTPLATPRYRFGTQLGQGGGGVVVKVWDERLKRSLAMKLARHSRIAGGPADQRVAEPEKLARFVDEALITSQLDHPGIVPIHELGCDEGRPYFTMKLVNGEDLSTIFQHVRHGTDGWNKTRAVGVLLRMCEAMAYAHDKNVVHRDLKPANVMVGRYGEVYVMDWGLARVIETPQRAGAVSPLSASAVIDVGKATSDQEQSAPSRRTRHGQLVGTPSYMSPEQARGELDAVGPRADVYSVGAMLYELLCGTPPHRTRGDEPELDELLRRIALEEPIPLARAAPDAPQDLIAICNRALAREPSRRYAGMRELGSDLRAYLEGRVAAAHEVGAWTRALYWVRRNRAFSFSLLAGAIALFAVAVAVHQKSLDEAHENAVTVLKQFDSFTTDVTAPWSEDDAPHGDTWREEAGVLVKAIEEALTLLDANPRSATASPIVGGGQRPASRIAPVTGLDSEIQLLVARAEWMSRMLNDTQADEADVEQQLRSMPAERESKLSQARNSVKPDRTQYGFENAACRVLQEAVATSPSSALHLQEKLAYALHAVGEQGRALAEHESWLRRQPDLVDAFLSNERIATTPRWSVAAKVWLDHSSSLSAASRPVQQCSTKDVAGEINLLLAQTPEVLASLLVKDLGEGPWSISVEVPEDCSMLLRISGQPEELLRFGRPETHCWYQRPGEPSHVEIHCSGSRAADAPRIALRRYDFQLPGLVARWRDPEQLKLRRDERNRLVKRIGDLRALEVPEREQGATDREWSREENIFRLRTALAFLERRLSLANQEIGASDAAMSWGDVNVAIRTSRKYGNLVITPQIGLVPLGQDPDSTLLEFAILSTGVTPVRDAAGRLRISGQTGVVLVLLPSWVDDDGLHTHPPFFLSKFELTEGQQRRMEMPFVEDLPDDDKSLLPTLTTWKEIEPCLANLGWGITLPTSTQWTYGCRAGTGTRWWTGDDIDSLEGSEHFEALTPCDSRQRLPVGSLRANPFGLHDVHGNVDELCRDEEASISAASQTFRRDAAPRHPVAGGRFDARPETTSWNIRRNPIRQDQAVGIRLARPLFK